METTKKWMRMVLQVMAGLFVRSYGMFGRRPSNGIMTLVRLRPWVVGLVPLIVAIELAMLWIYPLDTGPDTVFRLGAVLTLMVGMYGGYCIKMNTMSCGIINPRHRKRVLYALCAVVAVVVTIYTLSLFRDVEIFGRTIGWIFTMGVELLIGVCLGVAIVFMVTKGVVNFVITAIRNARLVPELRERFYEGTRVRSALESSQVKAVNTIASVIVMLRGTKGRPKDHVVLSVVSARLALEHTLAELLPDAIQRDAFLERARREMEEDKAVAEAKKA